MKNSAKAHAYHYSEPKNLVQFIADWGVPVLVFIFYFKFYNAGVVSPSEMVKTTGLVSISLLAITLLIGPVCRFVPALNILKAHRKAWGISSFLFALAHLLLVVNFY